MIDRNKLRFRIGDTVVCNGRKFKVKAYYFSDGFGNYSGIYGYTIDYPRHSGRDFSYDECGNPMGFAKKTVYYIRENEVEAVNSSNKKTMEVSLEQALRWYNSNSADLQALALSLFSEEELKMTYNTVEGLIPTESVCLKVAGNSREEASLKTHAKLKLIAYYLNQGWTMKPGMVGHFIAKDENKPFKPLVPGYSHVIKNHSTLMNAGVVYFKSEYAAKKAYQILGASEIENLFI